MRRPTRESMPHSAPRSAARVGCQANRTHFSSRGPLALRTPSDAPAFGNQPCVSRPAREEQRSGSCFR